MPVYPFTRQKLITAEEYTPSELTCLQQTKRMRKVKQDTVQSLNLIIMINITMQLTQEDLKPRIKKKKKITSANQFLHTAIK